MSQLFAYENPWEAVVDYLDHIGVQEVFGLPSDDLGFLESLETKSKSRMILCKDQRNAVFMAVGHAMESEKPGVCVVGKGPALTNALTGLLEAKSLAAPLILIATGTRINRLGTKAFQELDQRSLVQPLVKWSYRVDHPDRLCWALEKGALLAVNGTPGPVYIEIPEQMFEEKIPRKKPWEPLIVRRFLPDETSMAQSLQLIRASNRPLLLLGGGMRKSKARSEIIRFTEQWGAALFVTASGRGAVPEDHPLFCGLAGLYATEPIRRLWKETDLVVVLGSRLEETATFGWEQMNPKATLIQVNIEPDDWSLEYPGMHMLGDGGLVVEGWLKEIKEEPLVQNQEWIKNIQVYRRELFQKANEHLKNARTDPFIHVAEILDVVDRIVTKDRILVQENGLQDMWSYFYPYYSCGGEGGAVLPSDQTSLGFGAAAVAGVKLAVKERPVIAWIGDGAFQLFKSDLKTVVEQKIPIMYIVLKNGGYGWLQHQWNQQEHHSSEHSRYHFTSPPDHFQWGVDHPQIECLEIIGKTQLEQTLQQAYQFQLKGKTVVVEIPVQLGDIPPGMQAIEGDFPGKEHVTIGN
ncbi:acetolactate synthase-1/2/3 large subunit [Desmospora activa DSM 45169]|uniref:Acetolactate synthase-1/2/3 large subunit n=1 Tax=Desmospora activa DSM 45169 TaxID=1121389 RepID=A0A2T4ZAD4_9BACL|nr:acetolactate synthase-1/2/3 large subunit [Desmospora activa DSM 45169]